jgi:uncharacterized protein (TIGR03790 family)
LLLLAAAWVLAGCSGESTRAIAGPTTRDSKRVLVVYNASSDAGKVLADYYATRRGIPESNIIRLECTAGEEISDRNFKDSIEAPIKANLRRNPNSIDFIVLIKGIPFRLANEQHYSVDAWIAAADLPIQPITQLTNEALAKSLNPYFNSTEPFSSSKFGFYLVTRIDGYTTEDCRSLIDHSIIARPEKGPFFFDEAENRKVAAYVAMQKTLGKAVDVLGRKGFEASLETTKDFVAPSERLAGYASWGSNDEAFDLRTYKRLRFKPGALCETFVSTSGRTFKPTEGGQSLIADLIANGATGVKGYVSEPYTFALAKPDILFDRYTSGRNLAESFYAASMFLKWKDVVIGDPLCSPYAK